METSVLGRTAQDFAKQMLLAVNLGQVFAAVFDQLGAGFAAPPVLSLSFDNKRSRPNLVTAQHKLAPRGEWKYGMLSSCAPSRVSDRA